MKIKQLFAIALMCIMMCGTGLVAHAQEHVCAFSYMGTNQVSNQHVSSHTYSVYNAGTGKSETKMCQVYNRAHVEIWKCACGATEQRNMSTTVIHTGCGQ